jgi:hypothetical protein
LHIIHFQSSIDIDALTGNLQIALCLSSFAIDALTGNSHKLQCQLFAIKNNQDVLNTLTGITDNKENRFILALFTL